MDEGKVFYVSSKRRPNDYVLDVVSNLVNGKNVTLKARGKATAVACDVAEIARNRFVQDAKYLAIELSTEEIERDVEGSDEKVKKNITAINIVLGK